MRIFFLKNEIVRVFLKCCFILLGFFSFISIANAIETYEPLETITIGEFIYNDDYTPTMDDCTISIYPPGGGAPLVDTVTTTANTTGWHYYSYVTPATEGKYPAFLTCGTEAGGDLLKMDKSFILKSSTIAEDVWTYATRTLTSSAPPQVIILNMEDVVIPEISANVRITNEGFASFEYQYEWCVVTSFSNDCGGGDDVYYASAAKLIDPGEDFDTTLTATVPVEGNYYFKVAVYYGVGEKSRASRSFTAEAESSGGGGGGGGGGEDPPPPVDSCTKRGDFNSDLEVNSIDFSILLYYWKSEPPFANICVDINEDDEVDSIDFSIMLYEWGS